MISYLTQALRNWRDRDLIAAEKKRNAIVKAIHTRKAAHREFRPLYGDLREATNASLRVSARRA